MNSKYKPVCSWSIGNFQSEESLGFPSSRCYPWIWNDNSSQVKQAWRAKARTKGSPPLGPGTQCGHRAKGCAPPIPQQWPLQEVPGIALQLWTETSLLIGLISFWSFIGPLFWWAQSLLCLLYLAWYAGAKTTKKMLGLAFLSFINTSGQWVSLSFSSRHLLAW